MENITDKLNQVDDNDLPWSNWSLEEVKKLLDIYLIISKKETHIFDLIYSYRGGDNWEDIFRDYDTIYFENKATGVETAISKRTN
tara:strand:+ start:596 stop:850 length:255 start_codon:yes stop_codon:yes gene_type:complete